MFTHGEKDLASFRLFTTQLVINGTASHGQIARAFGVPLRTVKRYTKRFREHGAEAFFKPVPKRCGHRLTAERLMDAQRKLDEGLGVPEISQQLGVLQSTLHKAIGAGRLRAVLCQKSVPATVFTTHLCPNHLQALIAITAPPLTFSPHPKTTKPWDRQHP